MRVRITQQQPAGAMLGGVPWPDEGEEIELPTAQAAHLVASGVAEEVADPESKRKRRTKSQEEGGG
ncbi:hypothetical protein PV383_38445 [Streptomyces caniscabiei]|uniref:Uncharacterized protein n=1 Tax=Streptomyces caniscabiei TaxID=2746961 RepID=A0ABU4N3B0_9ACTN|nr:hypothetical protein [Streptomyces caniscabiei]MDX2946814.1 hypothetical protein [Streptomyces caniscabiei]MDX3043018.1 hypothetical protein [Streptomyces caniscabiei]